MSIIKTQFGLKKEVFMINRFLVKVNDTQKQFKELSEATQFITNMEKLGYNCELFLVCFGIYEEHKYSLYSTLEKDNIREQLKKLGVV